MIRHGNQIRLTQSEYEQFCKDSGASFRPATVEEYNAALQETIDVYRGADGTPESRLLAYLLELQLLTDDDTTPMPGNLMSGNKSAAWNAAEELFLPDEEDFNVFSPLPTVVKPQELS